MKLLYRYRPMPLALLLSLLLSLPLSTSSVWAQEQLPDSRAEKSSGQKDSNQKEEPPIDKIPSMTNNNNSGNKRFIPTEEISKDLSVAFPVDI